MLLRRTMWMWALLACAWCQAAGAAEARYEVGFPDLPEYKTWVVDLHMHTVFSDGQVWPTVRVVEAWRTGLHAIAISDHIEYQPHKEDVPTKHNRPYEIALGAARDRGLLLVRAAEITRDTPPGHFNAVFLDDIQPLDTPGFVDSLEEAKKQGAFVFWNHQGWKGEEKGRWMDVHTEIFDKKLFQGMEVCNGNSYFPTAHQWCLEKNLTMMGTSDIHDTETRLKNTASDHRTVTLVFIKEPTAVGLKEALLAGRTLVWFKDQLIGKPEWLEAMFKAGVRVLPPNSRGKAHIFFAVENSLPCDLVLKQAGNVGPAEIVLPAKATALIRLPAKEPNSPQELKYTVSNWLVAPQKGLDVTLTVAGK